MFSFAAPGFSSLCTQSLTLWQAFIRNLLRPLEVTQLPYSFGVGFIAALCMFLTEKRQRVGDLLARTIVVDSRTVPYPAYRRSQVYVRVATVLTLLACFVAYCSRFYYYDHPPLVV